uniref:G-protein coupled receptors family 1 profile domain-containing protein n=1 Tax=Eptatretus burgeri TaxID=7764 RepID=A0A8C4WWA9_EPTBU
MNQTGQGSLPQKVTLVISGFSTDQGGQVVVLIFTVILGISVFLNFGVIMACVYNRFSTPMLLYIALSSLSDTFWGIAGVSCHFKRIITLRQVISFNGCLVQMFIIYFSLFLQFLTTWLMYVDRHWAIFHPYSYIALMSNRGGAVKLAIAVSIFGLLLSISYVFITTRLMFCTIAKSACGNVYFSILFSLAGSYFVYGLTGLTAFYSTYCIVRKCRKSSTEANVKALHTCFTQLFASLSQFLSLVFIGLLKRFVQLPTVDFFAGMITVVAPAVMNPLIFGLRIQEILCSSQIKLFIQHLMDIPRASYLHLKDVIKK